MITRGHPAETAAVLLLGLPNLVWLALTLGLGASWEGKVEGPSGCPCPRCSTPSCALPTSPP